MKNKKRIAWNKNLTKETDIRIAKQAEKNRIAVLEGRCGMKNKKHRQESKDKTSNSLLNHKVSDTTRKKISKKLKGRESKKKGSIMSDRQKEKISKTLIDKFANDTEFVEKWVKSFYKKPTKPEIKLKELLNDNFPNEYRYVGNFKVWIGGKNPDFINVNGKKKIIELFGDYWHGEKITGSSKEKNENDRIDYFKKFDFSTLIIWESELNNVENVINKIMIFNGMV